MDTLIEFDYDINECWSFKGDPCKDFFVFNIHNVDFSAFLCHSDFTWNQFWSFWPFELLWIFNFWDFWHFQVLNFSTNKNAKLPKNDSFWPCEISQNWFHVKSEWQEKLLNFHTVLLKYEIGVRLSISVHFPHICRTLWSVQKSVQLF